MDFTILDMEELEDSQYLEAKNSFEEFTTSHGTVLKTIGLPIKIK